LNQLVSLKILLAPFDPSRFKLLNAGTLGFK
jgi:hypothetical protein